MQLNSIITQYVTFINYIRKAIEELHIVKFILNAGIPNTLFSNRVLHTVDISPYQVHLIERMQVNV